MVSSSRVVRPPHASQEVRRATEASRCVRGMARYDSSPGDAVWFAF
jgi:hypothetical protein